MYEASASPLSPSSQSDGFTLSECDIHDKFQIRQTRRQRLANHARDRYRTYHPYPQKRQIPNQKDTTATPSHPHKRQIQNVPSVSPKQILQMADVKALEILSAQIKDLRKLPLPPKNIDGVDTYRGSMKEVLDGAQSAVSQVKTYVEDVEVKLQELKQAHQDILRDNQRAIQNILEKLKESLHNTEPAKRITEGQYTVGTSTRQHNTNTSHVALRDLSLAHELEKITLELTNDRLNELLQETKMACTKLKNGANLSKDDIENLQGCLRSWVDVKKESFEVEKQKRLEAQKRKSDEKKRRIEMEEMTKKEEEERAKREEEEQKQKEEEEKRIKEEEERLRKEEEERRRMENEKRLKREKAERLRKEEELRKEEADRKIKEERERLERERIEKERLQKEAEERAWRQNPSNWSPITFTRDCDEVDGKKVYHGGINCVVLSPPGGIEEDHIECSYSDEVDSIIDVLENRETPVSSLIEIRSKRGTLHTEVPSRVYIPHNTAINIGDETVVKLTKDDMEWITVTPELTTLNTPEQQEPAKQMVGVEVNDFDFLKAIVVTRQRSQAIWVDKPGVNTSLSMDTNVKLFVPRDAFKSKTELTLMVQRVHEEALDMLKKHADSFQNVLSVNTLITLDCARRPEKAIELDVVKLSKKSRKFQRGKTYQLYASKDKVWKFADVEFKGNTEDITVTIPPGRERYTIMELEVQSMFPKENIPMLAEALFNCINANIVTLVVRQHIECPEKCTLRIMRREEVKEKLSFLEEHGYTNGPGECAEFRIMDGQQLEVSFTGNIEAVDDEGSLRKFAYLSYLGGIATDITLRVKDPWKQKDLPSYIGTIKCKVYGEIPLSEHVLARTIELNLCLPKTVTKRATIVVAGVKFPYYLNSLTYFLSDRLCQDDRHNWQSVLKTLLGNSEFNTVYRIARRKSTQSTDTSVCRAMLVDWMKTRAVHTDKISPILDALNRNGHRHLTEACQEFVKFQKEHLSDAVLESFAQKITTDVHSLSNALGISREKVDICLKEHQVTVTDQYLAVLQAWRESEEILKHGNKAVQFLKSVCV